LSVVTVLAERPSGGSAAAERSVRRKREPVRRPGRRNGLVFSITDSKT